MRLCTFVIRGDAPGQERVGVVREDRILELEHQTSMMEVIRSGALADDLETSGEPHDMEEIALKAPLPRPGKIIATIVNTQAMLGGMDISIDRPRLDMKAPSAVIGPGTVIMAPSVGIRPEVELAAVVGRRIARATEEEAGGCIAGYTILNDVTAPSDSREDAYEAYRRERGTGKMAKLTMRGPLFRSKNHDTFCPMGPWLVTPDENLNWSKLRMTTRFDGALVQDGNTSEYIFSPARIASYLSGFLTLEPGDVVSCGSVGWTKAALGSLDPTEFVLPSKAGSLELEIEGVGKLVNPVTVIASH